MIDVYFDFISPFGWIGAEKVGAIARRFDRELRWHPFLLKVTVLETMQLPPPLETPLKGTYLLHDIKRSLRYHGLSMAAAPRIGFSSVTAARLVLWSRQTAPQLTEILVLSLYRAHWSDGLDISETETVLDIAAAAGLTRRDAAAALASEAMKTALREEVDAAVQAGIFGSPTFVVDGEAFWGSDRLSMLEKWIETGGW
jgi:2-hydroxychromene-2-carboxylate isomerase